MAYVSSTSESGPWSVGVVNGPSGTERKFIQHESLAPSAEILPVPADSGLVIPDHITLVYYAKCIVLLETPEMEISACLPI